MLAPDSPVIPAKLMAALLTLLIEFGGGTIAYMFPIIAILRGVLPALLGRLKDNPARG